MYLDINLKPDNVYVSALFHTDLVVKIMIPVLTFFVADFSKSGIIS